MDRTLLGFVLVRFLRNCVNFTLLRTKEPETTTCSQRTTTIFWPLRSSLAITDARRPSMCVRPSTSTTSWNTILRRRSLFVQLQARWLAKLIVIAPGRCTYQ